jgi:hypothetical protein
MMTYAQTVAAAQVRQGAAGLTARKLEQLRMLADWQLVERGYDPAAITAACLALDTQKGL